MLAKSVMKPTGTLIDRWLRLESRWKVNDLYSLNLCESSTETISGVVNELLKEHPLDGRFNIFTAPVVAQDERQAVWFGDV